MLSSAEVTTLLSKLRIDLGFCLPTADCERLRAECPPDVTSFTDAIFVAEGLPPQTADLRLYRRVKAEVTATFHQHNEYKQFVPLLPNRSA